MSNIATAERVSLEPSDNFVLQRSRLAYHFAAELISGDVLEIGTGSGYGVEILAPNTRSLTTVDKHLPATSSRREGVNYIEATVPALPFADCSFDCVVSFQVIEHIRRDDDFIAECHRVLRPGGKLIITTPNRLASLTRNPWHVREYTQPQIEKLISTHFKQVEVLSVVGNERVMEYYQRNRLSVAGFKRWDLFDLENRLPRWLLRIPYDILNRINRRKLLDENNSLTQSIEMNDYSIGVSNMLAFDLFCTATK